MIILQELLKLKEEADLAQNPMELDVFVDGHKDLGDSFPKLLKKKWNMPGKIVWHGQPLYVNNEHGYLDHGPALEKAQEAIYEYVADGYTVEGNITIHNVLPEHTDAEPDEEGEGGSHMEESAELDMKFDFRDPAQDLKLEFWGFDQEEDAIIMGFDAWPSSPDEVFNEAFDEAFKEMTGLHHDMDDEDHMKVFNPAWEEFKKESFTFWGLVFRVTTRDGENFHVQEEVPGMTGGFHRSDSNRILMQAIKAGKIWVSPYI